MFFVTFFIVLTIFQSGFTLRSCSTPEVTEKWGPYLQQVTAPFEHGEEPYWDYRVQKLYFVDLHKGLVNSLDPETNEINSVQFAGDASPIIPMKTLNKFALGNNNSFTTFVWDGKSDSQPQNFTVLATVDTDKPGNRFNDGKPDKYGRLWWGTIGYENSSGVIPNLASLYLFTNENYQNPTVEIRPVTNSNGLAWNKNNTKFYYIDTPTRKIAAYDFDLEKGEISNKQIAFDLENYDIGGSPDGMTIDAEDNLFIALFNGGAVIKINPTTGKLLQKISIPAKQVTSCMFGGRNLDILFVTTSRYGLSEEELSSQPSAGALFAITGLKTKGTNMYFSENFP